MQQHGDVLINKINKLPKNLKKIEPRNGRNILADGEVTGHAHAITDIKNSDLFEDKDGTLYLKCNASVELTHEEHDTQIIEPGIYEIGIVQEVDPFEDIIRKVAD